MCLQPYLLRGVVPAAKVCNSRSSTSVKQNSALISVHNRLLLSVGSFSNESPPFSNFSFALSSDVGGGVSAKCENSCFDEIKRSRDEMKGALKRYQRQQEADWWETDSQNKIHRST
jgi:hypothetical protein